MTLPSTADKRAAADRAATFGVGSLDSNQRAAFDAAMKDMTDIGRQAANIAEGKPPGESRRGFFGI